MQTSMMVPVGGAADVVALVLSNGHKIRMMQHTKQDVKEDTYMDVNDGVLTSGLGHRKCRARHWSWVVFKSPVERLQKDWQLDWTDKGCNWTAVACCMVLGVVHRVVKDQLNVVAIETGLYRGRGIFYMKTEVFVDILYAKNTDK